MYLHACLHLHSNMLAHQPHTKHTNPRTVHTLLQVPAEKVEFLEVAKEHKGKSEPLFLLYRVGEAALRADAMHAPCVAPACP